MKIIDTSRVNANKWLPLLGNYGGGGANAFATTGGTSSMVGIDFIQQAYTECLNAISEFAIADTSKVTVMYGCTQYYTPPALFTFDDYYESHYYTESPNIYGINPGWIYYQGELYYVQAFPYTTVAAGHYVNATITIVPSNADAATFSNASTHNIHVIRIITFTVSETSYSTLTGENIPDYSFWKFAGNNSNAQTPVSAIINNWITNTWTTFTNSYTALTTPTPTIVGTSNNPQFENGWVSSGLTEDSPNALSYYKVCNRVFLWGEISLSSSSAIKSSTIFHLPAGFHPMSTEELFAVPDTSAANYSTGGNNVANTWYIWIQSDGSVTFLGNVPTVEGTAATKISLSGINFLTGVYIPPFKILAPFS